MGVEEILEEMINVNGVGDMEFFFKFFFKLRVLGKNESIEFEDMYEEKVGLVVFFVCLMGGRNVD